MDFWQRLEALVKQSGYTIDRPKDSSHPKFSEIVYPLDYGYLKDTKGGDGEGIDIWIGSAHEERVEGAIMTVDSFKKDAEVKILYKCTPAEMRMVASFHSVNQQSAMLVLRNDS